MSKKFKDPCSNVVYVHCQTLHRHTSPVSKSRLVISYLNSVIWAVVGLSLVGMASCAASSVKGGLQASTALRMKTHNANVSDALHFSYIFSCWTDKYSQLQSQQKGRKHKQASH